MPRRVGAKGGRAPAPGGHGHARQEIPSRSTSRFSLGEDETVPFLRLLPEVNQTEWGTNNNCGSYPGAQGQEAQAHPSQAVDWQAG